MRSPTTLPPISPAEDGRKFANPSRPVGKHSSSGGGSSLNLEKRQKLKQQVNLELAKPNSGPAYTSLSMREAGKEKKRSPFQLKQLWCLKTLPSSRGETQRERIEEKRKLSLCQGFHLLDSENSVFSFVFSLSLSLHLLCAERFPCRQTTNEQKRI